MTAPGTPVHNLRRKGTGAVSHAVKARVHGGSIITECGRCGVRPGWPAWDRACSRGGANLEKVAREIKSENQMKFLKGNRK